MERIACVDCWKQPLSKDEIGICKKLLGAKTKNMYCICCLAVYLETTVEELTERIEAFKEDGCLLFK